MSTLLVEISTGWTDTLGPFTLKADGVPADLAGLDIDMYTQIGDGTETLMPGELTILTQSGDTLGQVTYTPATATEFVYVDTLPIRYTLYRVRFRVSQPGREVSFPSGEPDEIKVWK
jgi:hypothetical protein